jgi:sortase A
MTDNQNKKLKILKALAIALELLALGLFIYLIALPFYPKIKYSVKSNKAEINKEAKDIEKIKAQVQEFNNSFPEADYDISPNRLIIKKIGVNSPIVETKDSEYGLSLGAWRVPESSVPDKDSNTVLTGHRFKYLPPNNLTFYLLDKLEKDDIISVIWKGRDYYYRVRENKIVAPTELSILNPSTTPILTLYTCDPIYSQKNRLVVVADLISDKATSTLKQDAIIKK